MGRRVVLLVAFALTSLGLATAADPFPAASPESVGLSSQRLERLAHAIRADVERGRMPGAIVAIARNGKLAYYDAFGYLDATAKTPMPKTRSSRRRR